MIRRATPLPVATALALCLSVAAAAGASTAGQALAAPIAAKPDASDEARRAPATLRLELPEGDTKGVAMATAAAGSDATFLYAPPVGAMVSVGVSSKSGEARLMLFEPGAEAPILGTDEAAGAIRWIGTFTRPGDHRIVVRTAGEETPVRVEVAILLAAGAADEDP